MSCLKFVSKSGAPVASWSQPSLPIKEQGLYSDPYFIEIRLNLADC